MSRCIVAALATLGSLAALPAFADVIDGYWCFPDGRRMAIEGPAIVTPGGTTTSGDYARHYFTYIAPPGDRDAGQTISMALLNEETVRLRVGNADASEVWHRCGPPTS